MTIFKIIKHGQLVFFKVNTTNRVKAVRMLWKTFGDNIKYDIM